MTQPIESASLDEIVGAPGPHPEHADALMLFGQLVGSWDVVSTQFAPDGRTRTLRGEWHFFWVLEGRAIQDVIIAPPRGERDRTKWVEGDYQTAIRFYRPSDGSWDVTAISPPHNQIRRLVARREDDKIVLRGTAPDGQHVRWMFYEITTERCRWRGQVSSDGGETWVTEEEMILTRRRE